MIGGLRWSLVRLASAVVFVVGLTQKSFGLRMRNEQSLAKPHRLDLPAPTSIKQSRFSNSGGPADLANSVITLFHFFLHPTSRRYRSGRPDRLIIRRMAVNVFSLSGQNRDIRFRMTKKGLSEDFNIESVARRGAFIHLHRVPVLGFRWENDMEDSEGSRGPWLVANSSDGSREYPPLRHPTLHREFATLGRNVTKQQIKTFADRWGSLGHSLALMDRTVGQVRWGSHLQYWKDQIKRMAGLTAIWDYVCEKDSSSLRRHIQWKNGPSVRFRFYDDTRSENRSLIVDRWKLNDTIEPARFFVQEEVNRAMSGSISPGILPFVEGRMFFRPDCLLSCLYLLFALEITDQQSGGAFRVCKGCQEPFMLGPRERLRSYCDRQCQERTKKRKQRGRD